MRLKNGLRIYLGWILTVALLISVFFTMKFMRIWKRNLRVALTSSEQRCQTQWKKFHKNDLGWSWKIVLNSVTNSKDKLKDSLQYQHQQKSSLEMKEICLAKTRKRERGLYSVEYSREHFIDFLTILTWIQKLFREKVSCSSFRWYDITSTLVWTWCKCKKQKGMLDYYSSSS